MTRLFMRFYLALVVVVALCAATAVAVTRVDLGLPSRLQAVALAPGLVTEDLARASDPESRLLALEGISAQLDTPVVVEPMARVFDTLDALEAERIERGEPVVVRWEGREALLVRVPDQPLVAVVQTSTSPSRWRVFLVALVLIAGLTGAVGVTLWPMQRQLEILSRASARFGAGHLDARTRVLTHDAAGHLATSFNHMAERVAELVRGREELLLGVSHELRTPISRLRFATELLVESESLEDRRTRGARVQRDLVELDLLVGELLEYTSLDEGIRLLSAEDLALGAELDELVADAASLSPYVRVERTGDAATLCADRRLLRRAVGNLLVNAVRHARAEVRLSIVDGPGEVCIHVEDDGPGVPEADRERILEPLVRLDATRSRDTGGVGLGLSLAHRIARAHGGELTVESSTLLGGARFNLVIPR